MPLPAMPTACAVTWTALHKRSTTCLTGERNNWSMQYQESFVLPSWLGVKLAFVSNAIAHVLQTSASQLSHVDCNGKNCESS